MPDNVRVSFQPANANITVPAGTTILEAAFAAGLALTAICGGRADCHKCRVQAPDYPGTIRPAERQAFTEAELAAGWRLACVCKVHHDVQVFAVPVEDFAPKSFIGGRQVAVPLQSAVRRWRVQAPPPTVSDQRSDWQRLQEAIPGGGDLSVHHRALAGLAEVARNADWHVAITAIGNRAVAIEPNTLRPPLGVAIDIGTTSVVAMLVDLTTGQAVSLQAGSNSQVAHGADVMARIDFAGTSGGLERLQKEIVRDLNRAIAACCREVAAEPEDIYEVTIAANTIMAHLFLGLNPAYVGVSPFTGVTNMAVTVPAAEVGLLLHPQAMVYLLPGVAGFVGADTVGVVLAAQLYQADRTVAAIDIGTNTEVVLAHDGRLLTCSAPAGPAFEGGEIKHGMRATTGAISRFDVTADGTQYTTIGNARPLGICGSALVDLCAELAAYGLINPSGRLLSRADLLAGGRADPLGLAERVIEPDGGVRAFLLVEAAESGTGGPIYLSQLDIRKYQLAKAAARAGLWAALAAVGLTEADLDEVIIAGTFGSHVRVRQAIRSGLIPPVAPEKVRYVGNAAHEGARIALLNTAARHEIETVARRFEHIETAAWPQFQDVYIECLGFPDTGLGRPRSGTGASRP